MPTSPSKEAQDAEATARAVSKTTIPPGETAQALEVVGDTDGGEAARPGAAPAAGKPEPQQRELPPALSAFDKKRGDIQARFRSERNIAAEEAKDEVTEFARTNGMPPEFQQLQEPEAEAAPADAAPGGEGDQAPAVDESVPLEDPPAEQKYKVKVHGKEIEVTLDDLIANAQKALAADNLLDESKSKLKEVEALLIETKNRAARPAQDSQHQAAPNQTQSPEQLQQPAAEPNQPERKKLIEAIQFGDPDEAESLLQNTIAEEAKQIVTQQLLEGRLRDEGARAAKVLKDFEDQHPDIAKDDRARAAIEVSIYQMQREDLTALGLDPDRIRQDGQPATPADIANAHRFYRAQGFNVTSPHEMLEKARDSFLDWKGIKKANPPAPGDNPPKGPPKVDVSIDRTARRQAIPQQPSRTSTPTRQPAAPAAQPKDRSSIVAEEKARRAKLRGQQLGI